MKVKKIRTRNQSQSEANNSARNNQVRTKVVTKLFATQQDLKNMDDIITHMVQALMEKVRSREPKNKEKEGSLRSMTLANK